MGTDKWKLMLDGRSFVERIADEIAEVASSVTVVGNVYRCSDTDTLDGSSNRARRLSAMGGAWRRAHRACRIVPADWALVVACDFPFVTKELFLRLASLRDDFEAVAPVQHDQIPQPLCSLYRVEPCRRRAEDLIKSGERKPIALLQSVHTRWVLFSELEDIAGAARFFDNINTPSGL